MSTILVQIGQCGNQVGQSLLEAISEDSLNKLNSGHVSRQRQRYLEIIADRFFTRTKNDIWRPRAVLVDTEHKVIKRMLEPRKQQWSYSRKNALELSGGCGNLWSRGFCEYGPLLSEKVVDIVQAELEKCDSVGGLVILMSAAGGTGSGVGSHVTKVLRDILPRTFIINQLVWPYSAGEIVIQSYNSLLTLSNILPYSDGVINFHNDELHNVCSRFNSSVQIEHLNRVLSSQFASVLCPSFDSTNRVTRLGDLLQHVTTHPAFKMMSVKSVPHTSPQAKDFSTETWNGLKKLLSREIGNKHISISDLAILRGKDAKSASSSEFLNFRRYSNVISREAACQMWHEEIPFANDPLSVVLVSNDDSSVPILEKTTERAWRLMSNGAYLHHLAKHGIGQEQLADSMTSIAQLCTSYKLLVCKR